MLDVRELRENTNVISEKLKTRGFNLDVEKTLALESERKTLQVATQELQNERNIRSKEIGIAKAKGENVESVLALMGKINDDLKIKEEELEKIQQELLDIYTRVPNIPHDSVPVGTSEEDNLEVKRWGEPKEFAYKVLDHVDLGEHLQMMDFNLAAKLTGTRFVVLKSGLARLHRALIQFMLDLHTKEHGYQEVYVPYLVNNDSLFGTGQLPKFVDDLFNIGGGFPYSLIPTAEVPVTNFVRDEIIDEKILPLKFVAHTPCFRSEVGAYGKDLRGMIRNHQFEKVELVQIVKPESSYSALEELTAHAEKVLQSLELPFRRVLLCTSDMGFCSAKTYDLEVWLPGQNRYREISSCSNMEAFQARRMQARLKRQETGKKEFVHTLNGSGLAVGRTLIAIMENYQDEQGRIHIPTVLQKYMDGMQIIDMLK